MSSVWGAVFGYLSLYSMFTVASSPHRQTGHGHGELQELLAGLGAGLVPIPGALILLSSVWSDPCWARHVADLSGFGQDIPVVSVLAGAGD
jgi:hypothetical protein